MSSRLRMKHELTTRETRNYHQTVREDARSYGTRPASILVVLIGGQRSPGEQCSTTRMGLAWRALLASTNILAKCVLGPSRVSAKLGMTGNQAYGLGRVVLVRVRVHWSWPCNTLLLILDT